jgi:hypothetical protein
MDPADLRDVFPDMQPITAAPSLHTINGIGLSLYGARDRHAETGTYVATRYLVFLFIPVLALGAYRVAKAPGDQGWYFLGKVPLGTVAKAWNLLLAAILFVSLGALATR